ncbi:hypothetical protein F3Y22_tig00003041pilonHSYRG00335 [Hibiscus syriacus]|uniref:Uncharacterized protein n=1 Tax=Hibiscus syriacus TaxID=106335 RepID=A0A6A3CMM5_HIBSY|nr:hypothetical protein F3Y22_tig00003041pilonHSYRG00335 [Hibiscus syriacus]
MECIRLRRLVNSKATVMFSGIFNGEVHENIMWLDLPYATDEHGSTNLVSRFGTTKIMQEIKLSGLSEIDDDINFEDENDDDDDNDENYGEEWVATFEDEVDQDDFDGTLGDWAKLETMRSSYIMKTTWSKIQVASDDLIVWMEQPSDGLAIQGLLRPAFTDEHSEIQKHISINQSPGSDTGLAAKHFTTNTAIIRFQDNNGFSLPLQTNAKLEDFKQAQLDVIAPSAVNIISRLKAGGKKTTQALRSLCLRCKGIQVEVKRKNLKAMKSPEV